MAGESTAASSSAPPPVDARVVIFASGVVDEAKRPEFLERAEELRRRCLADAGTLAWSWFSDREDPSIVWIYEEYADDVALNVHRETVRGLLRPLLACFSERLVAHRCVPLMGAASAGEVFEDRGIDDVRPF